MTHLIESIESIYNSIPLWAKDYAKSVTIHIGTRDVDTEAVMKIFKDKSVSILQSEEIKTKHHKRHVFWILNGNRLHISISYFTQK